METHRPVPKPPRQQRMALWIGLSCLAIAALACSVVSRLPSAVDLPSVGNLPAIGMGEGAEWQAVPADAQSLPDLVEAGSASVDKIVAVDNGASGPILRVTIRNPGTEVLVVTIPCGTILAPDSGDVQQMMVVQPASASIPAGGTAEITVFVICIDATKDMPSVGDGFALGTLAEGDVLKLAECACQDGQIAGANPLPLIGLQFTAWMVREGLSPEDILASGEGAAGEFLGSEQAAQLGQLMESVGGYTGDWLERCGVEISP
jgi:hypothetical protein